MRVGKIKTFVRVDTFVHAGLPKIFKIKIVTIRVMREFQFTTN